VTFSKLADIFVIGTVFLCGVGFGLILSASEVLK
jgi:hypothetical protein